MKKRISFTILIALFSCISLCGCTKNKKESSKAYLQEINQFIDRITVLGDSLDAIDATSLDYSEQFLTKIDSLLQEFASLSEIEVPDYPHYHDLAVAASFYMEQASQYYHKAYENGYDEKLLPYADAFYDEALQNLRYIGYYFNGYNVEDVVHSLEELQAMTYQ